jgi:hypothetical protein
MNRRVCMSMVFSGIFLLNAGLAGAQDAAPMPPPQMVMLQGPGPEAGMIGERIELLGFEGMHGGKVVTGVPFSAIAVSETTQTLADGNHITRTTQTQLYRDSKGRFRKDVTLPAIGWLETSGQPKSFVFINDPVAGTNFVLHPEAKIAEKMEAPAGMMKDAVTGKMEYHQEQAIADGSVKKEDLGMQTIAGVSAQGTCVTHTIPRGQIGNDNPIQVVVERWYSPDLQIVVQSTRTDPRFGTTKYTVTILNTAEPDAKLFKVPSDYTVTAGKNRMFRRFNGGPDAAPPPPPPSN